MRLVALALAAALVGWPSPSEGGPGKRLRLHLDFRPVLVDYELPGHPRETGRGHAGTIGSAYFAWALDSALTIEAGAMGRLPLAQDFEEELGAFPLLAFVVKPYGELLTLRFGSLDTRHGHHPALLDEPRYGYGRPYEELYNRSNVPAAARDLGGDPFMPTENGMQLIAKAESLRAEAYLDWQLLETSTHREKFAFGLLGAFESRYLDARFDYRLVHYGGQLFTQSEDIRRLGLDSKRQPTGMAFMVKGRPFINEVFTPELQAAFVQGRVIQRPGESESTHFGFELGLTAVLFESARLGYQLWLPRAGDARFIAEDGDPVFSGPRAHRVRVAVDSEYGIVTMSSRLDLVFQANTTKVQYLTVTTLSIHWDTVLW